MDELEKKTPRRKHDRYYSKNDSDTPLVAHKCVDCGKLTPDRRCKECLAKWRVRNHVVLYNTDE